MDVNQVLHLFQSGNYNACLKIFLTSTPEEGDTMFPLKLENINEATKKYLYQNNAVFCQAMLQQGTGQNWSNSLINYTKLYSNYRSLTVIPLDLELNVVYNILWLFLSKPNYSHYHYLHFKSILNIVSKCLIKVMKSCEEVVLGQDVCQDDATNVITMLKRASDHLLQLPPVLCMQLLDLMTLTVHALLRRNHTESIAECMSFMKKTIDQLQMLILHVQQHTLRGNEEIYFKFGMTRVNSTASLKNVVESINAFVITGSIICAINGELEHAMSCLKQHPDTEGNGFPFLVNYLKAYCCLRSQHYCEAKLCLAYIASSPLTPLYQAYYCVLLGQLQSEQGDCRNALVEYERALASIHPQRDQLSSLAAYRAAEEANKLHLSTVQLNYLKQLGQILRASKQDGGGQFEGFEEWCLSELSHQRNISVCEAVYTLARQLCIAGYHMKALDSYSDLLRELKTGLWEDTAGLPPRIQIVQETALAHVKANSSTGGEQFCRQLVKEYVPSGSCCLEAQQGCWETALYQIEEDVVSMLLLADLIANTDKRQAIDELNRSYNAVIESREQAVARRDTAETQLELCDWFLSRILLRKARLSQTDDAAHHFRRALMHKPGDKEVVFHYKQWALWHPDHQSFDPGDKVTTFPVDQIHNLALRHILICSVSEEEWTALFDQESSQNVLESLFDDDD